MINCFLMLVNLRYIFYIGFIFSFKTLCDSVPILSRVKGFSLDVI